MSIEVINDASVGSAGATAQPAFMQVPKSPKRHRKNKTTTPLVISSVSSSVPIVLPEVAPALVQETKSAPASPNDHKKGILKYLPRPHHHGRRHRSKEPKEHGHHAHRPKWLHFRGRRKSRSAEEVNGDSVSPGIPPEDNFNLDLSLSGCYLSSEPEATPVADLPGQQPSLVSSSTDIPTILVSHSADDRHYEYGNGNVREDEPMRKNSQSSHDSTQGTSGVGSCLSPSGDDSSDVESLLSPMSLGSSASIQSAASDVGVLSDFIEKDLPSPGSDPEASLGITTPPTPHDSPTPDGIVSPVSSSSPPVGSPSNASLFDSPVGSPAGGDSFGSPVGGDPLSSVLDKVRPSSRPHSPGRRKEEKKRKDNKLSKPWERWERVKKVVQAWSPFAMQFQKKKYRWVQLAGHQGNFAPGEESGTIQKKSDKNERVALKALMTDVLKNFVPEFKKEFERDGDMFLEMTDLLREFDEPAVMDIKLGIRTYLEDELVKARTQKTLRKDMYEKMIAIDPNEPTVEEHAQGAITKPRYMQWRESMSSTSTLGFRIEGIKTSEGKALKDFKTTRSREDVMAVLRSYLSEAPQLKGPFLKRLLEIRDALERSEFFRVHEVIGSSLLFVYDGSGLTSVNMIDFGKTVELPAGISINHRSPWEEGNHEDGYLCGLDNLIGLWQEL